MALSHIQAIFPELDLQAFRPFKEIKDDQFVDLVEESQDGQANISKAVEPRWTRDEALQDVGVVGLTSRSLPETATKPTLEPIEP